MPFVKRQIRYKISMEFIIGIDDTDNKESRGTGFRSRELAQFLERDGIATVKGITRHQLYVHPDIPFTSQNSSACLIVESDSFEKLQPYCRNYMLQTAADGSDVGLCIANPENVTKEIIKWGNDAKCTVLKKEDAHKLATQAGIYLEGLTGLKIGVIGALAGVGLRTHGNDGRFIKVFGIDLRDLTGIIEYKTLIETTAIDAVEEFEGQEVKHGKIDLGDWVRPILKEKKIVLIVESSNHENYEWQVARKEFVKKLSN